MSNATNTNLPAKKYTAFPIQVVVWENANAEGKVFKSFQLERLYKDKAGNWTSTQSLNADDVPKAMALLHHAYAAEAVTVERPGEPR